MKTDLCHLGGFPGPLRKLVGVWAEEIDCLDDGERNLVSGAGGQCVRVAGAVSGFVICAS